MPDIFINGCNSPRPLEVLRIVLGMYPQKIEMFDLDQLKPELLKLINDESLPAWYKSKALQMAYIANDFQLIPDAKAEADGIIMKTRPTVDGLIELCSMYE